MHLHLYLHYRDHDPSRGAIDIYDPRAFEMTEAGMDAFRATAEAAERDPLIYAVTASVVDREQTEPPDDWCAFCAAPDYRRHRRARETPFDPPHFLDHWQAVRAWLLNQAAT